MSDVSERLQDGRYVAEERGDASVFEAMGVPFVMRSELEATAKAETAASHQERLEAAFAASEEREAREAFERFTELDAKRDADLAPLWATYADEHAHQMRNDAGRSARRLQLAGFALRDAGVPTEAVKSYGEDLEIARQRGRPVPAPSFSIEAAARDERDRLRKKDPSDGRRPGARRGKAGRSRRPPRTPRRPRRSSRRP